MEGVLLIPRLILCVLSVIKLRDKGGKEKKSKVETPYLFFSF